MFEKLKFRSCQNRTRANVSFHSSLNVKHKPNNKQFRLRGKMTEIYCFICDNPVLGPEKAEYNALTALTKYSSTPVIEFVYKYVSADNFFGGKQYFCLECKERINRLDNLIEHQELLKQSIASDLANSVQKREDRTNVEHVEPEEEEVCLFTILEKDDDELEVEMSSEGTAEEPAEEEESTENNHSLVGVYKKCLRCNKHCTSKTEYRDHMKSHSSGEKANLICDICGCAYVSRSALNFHLKRHKDGGFRCTVCDRRFTQRGALNRHIAVHTGEKKYQVNTQVSLFVKSKKVVGLIIICILFLLGPVSS